MLSEALRKRLYFNPDVVSGFTSLFAVLQGGYGLALVRTDLPGKGILLGRTRLLSLRHSLPQRYDTHQPSRYARTALMSHTRTTFPHKSSYNFPFSSHLRLLARRSLHTLDSKKTRISYRCRVCAFDVILRLTQEGEK